MPSSNWEYRKGCKEDVTILLETFDCKLTSINELATICAEAITLATYKMENYKTEEKPSSSVDFYIHCDSQIEEDLKPWNRLWGSDEQCTPIIK